MTWQCEECGAQNGDFVVRCECGRDKADLGSIQVAPQGMPGRALAIYLTLPAGLLNVFVGYSSKSYLVGGIGLFQLLIAVLAILARSPVFLSFAGAMILLIACGNGLAIAGRTATSGLRGTTVLAICLVLFQVFIGCLFLSMYLQARRTYRVPGRGITTTE